MYARTKETMMDSVEHEIRLHQRALLDVESSVRRIARLHQCRSDILIRQALIRRSINARLIMQI